MSRERAIQTIVEACRSGLDSSTLRQAVAHALQSAISFDAWCLATIDPATLLVTGGISEGLPLSELAHIAELEYFTDDVNKFSSLARGPRQVALLSETMGGNLEGSQRFRELIAPLGYGDELRAAFVVDGVCWGAAGLFRSRAKGTFSPADAAFVARLAPHIAEGLRVALLIGTAANAATSPPDPTDGEAPGVILLDDDYSVEAITPPAKRWLVELPNARDAEQAGRLPDVVYTVAAQVRAPLGSAPTANVDGEHHPARARVRGRTGHWLVLHGTRLFGTAGEPGRIAVIVEIVHRPEIAPLIGQAYGLSPREREILQHVLRGLSTSEIAALLGISALTVQDHLKAIFEKLGAHSRRELMARFLTDHYFPHVQAGTRVGINGWFENET